jgi:DNA-binding NtrC family response regulator
MRRSAELIDLLLVDDDRWLAESMRDWLNNEGYDVKIANTMGDAKSALKKKPFDLVLCDIRLNDEDGFNLLEYARKNHPDIPFVMMTGYAGPDAGCEAIKRGAFDLLTKPIIDQELLAALQRATKQQAISRENEVLKAQLDRRLGLEAILSQDLRMRQIFEVIEAIADTRATVLITGENGTGKSMIARAIHKRSARTKQPFVEVACGALPDNLLESELFGHAAGAFTGANTSKTGKFELADNGTIFLDEIGTASPALQVKLLRVLQELQFEPLGSNETIFVDTRIVLATNEKLEQAVAEGKFRQDLFYRINVIHLELPALRERVDDIPLLVDHFIRAAAAQYGRNVEGVSPSVMSMLLGYSWPGNIRELENAIQRMVLLSKHSVIEFDVVPTSILNGSGLTPIQTNESITNHSTLIDAKAYRPPQTLSEALEAPERAIIREALELYQWNRNETADALGINRTTLYKKMKRLQLEDAASDAG